MGPVIVKIRQRPEQILETDNASPPSASLSNPCSIGSSGLQPAANLDHVQGASTTISSGTASGKNPSSSISPASNPLASKPTTPIRLFYSYSHKDEKLRNQLVSHLSILKREKVVLDWHDRMIGAGQEWKDQIDNELESAQIVLLLISPDFLASDYCYDIEMKRALERHERKEARVIPIILRPVDWKSALFGKLQALPKDGKPVVEWRPRDAGFKNVAEGIHRAVEEIAKNSLESSPSEHAQRTGRSGVLLDLGPSLESHPEAIQPSGTTVSPRKAEQVEVSSARPKRQLRCPHCGFKAEDMGAGTFCPNCGVRLIGKDWGLEVTGSDASEVESVASSLWAKNSPQMGTSDTGLRHDGRFTIEQDSVPLTTGRQGGDYQVVLLIHGIRTQADWGPMVRSKLEVPGKIEVIPIKYGYFDAFRFWFPFWTTQQADRASLHRDPGGSSEVP